LLVSTSYIWILDCAGQDFGFYLNANYTASFQLTGGANYITTSQVFRDPAAWYHMVIAVDTTQATAANRLKFYVNGNQVTAFSSASYPAQNTTFAWNQNGQVQYFGRNSANSAFLYDGYLTEFYSIDGQALTPSSFGSTNAATGVWQPARYTGTYGTNGFYLKFTDNSTAAALGTDFSGNSNTWTTNNISITAGVTYDSMTDVPTLTSATASNFAVLNPLVYFPVSTTIADGNLKMTGNSAGSHSISLCSIAMPSGKWYAEFTLSAIGGPVPILGLIDTATTPSSVSYLGATSATYGYASNGNKYNNASLVAYGATFTTGDIIAIAYDATAGSLTFYKNGTTQGVAYSGLTGTYFIACDALNAGSWSANFGQRPFAYTPPTGFVSLNTFNLPTSTIVKGSTSMNAVTWSGASSGTNLNVTGFGFQPDFVWGKNRSGTYDHFLQDAVRGITNGLSSNLTAAESTTSGSPTSFISDGFNISSTAGWSSLGNSNVTWAWKANGAGSTNTSGTITSTVSVNASAGFSVATFTTTGAAATIGHGLGVAPSFYVVKQRNGAASWLAYHASIPSAASQYLVLNLTDAVASNAGVWNNTAPTSSVFSMGTVFGAGTYVAYCWTPIAGYSAFGSYTGNGSTDGVFVYTGFKPRWVLIKRTDTAGFPWWLLDTARNTYNVADIGLLANSSDSESSAGFPYSTLDFVSNGFKLRATAGGVNASGGTYIYMAFASNPFRNSLAQ
jgi:hypothetical protein